MNRWQDFRERVFYDQHTGLTLDLSGIDTFPLLEDKMKTVFANMDALEMGAIANRDENRMVGHYWLRDPDLAPTFAIAEEIRQAKAEILSFARQVHEEGIFQNLLLIGIGGSSLGPAFVADALSKGKEDRMRLFLLDNTDPDGMDRIFSALEGQWEETLVLVISKSGGTVETRNGMEETKARYHNVTLSFPEHAVAITMKDSALDRLREKEHWLKSFPLWDWVGGRTSVLSPVGLLPLALLGADIDGLLAGAAASDRVTRQKAVGQNPAALLALAWHHLTGGKGGKEMVILPYKDRLSLFSRYLQQLVMESLGKEEDRKGNKVDQGIAVFGNKGATDQHSYVQQLLAGPANFFIVFLEVLAGRAGDSPIVGEESTSGDYLEAFLLGTGRALAAQRKDAITITIPQIDGYHIGVLLALFERTVGYYADLTDINAYHQPAVEMGKKSAGLMIELKNQLVDFLEARRGCSYTAPELAGLLQKENALSPLLEREEAPYYIFRILRYLAANQDGIDSEIGEKFIDTRFYCH